jgi:hypothetical protein
LAVASRDDNDQGQGAATRSRGAMAMKAGRDGATKAGRGSAMKAGHDDEKTRRSDEGRTPWQRRKDATLCVVLSFLVLKWTMTESRLGFVFKLDFGALESIQR